MHGHPEFVAAADHRLPPLRAVWFLIRPEATGRGFEAFCRGGVRSEQIGAIFGAFRGGPSPYLCRWRGGAFLCLKTFAFSYHPRDVVDAFLVLLRSEEHTSELQSRGHLVC